MDAVTSKDVLRGLAPSQQVVKIVRDEMVALFGDAEGGLQPTSKRPRVILLLGLQGAGKTTTVGQAGEVADQAGQASAAGVDRRQAAGGDPAAERRRAEGRRSRARSGRA